MWHLKRSKSNYDFLKKHKEEVRFKLIEPKILSNGWTLIRTGGKGAKGITCLLIEKGSKVRVCLESIFNFFNRICARLKFVFS